MYHILSVGRILGSLKGSKGSEDSNVSSQQSETDKMNKFENDKKVANSQQMSHFLPTSRRIVQFSNGKVLFLYLVSVSLVAHYFSLYAKNKSFHLLLCYFIFSQSYKTN